MKDTKSGVFYSIMAYVIWGFFPIYWKMLDHVSSLEILLNRIIWAFLSTLLLVLLLKQGRLLLKDLTYLWTKKKELLLLSTASVLISGNWLLYIWAINHNYLIETSLGYYINPLISILLGVLFLKEKMSKVQLTAFGLAMIGVLILVFAYGRFPYLAFGLAISFGLYGLVKKSIQLDALRIITIETFLVAPFAMIIYIWLFLQNDVAFLQIDMTTNILLIFTGIMTATPLILFSKGAQRIPLYMIGFLQYISPTMILLVGVIIYDESFELIDVLAFSCIWLALLLLTVAKLTELYSLRKAQGALSDTTSVGRTE